MLPYYDICALGQNVLALMNIPQKHARKIGGEIYSTLTISEVVQVLKISLGYVDIQMQARHF